MIGNKLGKGAAAPLHGDDNIRKVLNFAFALVGFKMLNGLANNVANTLDNKIIAKLTNKPGIGPSMPSPHSPRGF
ncbi:MAG: hypothetical protein KAS59_04965 [Alphaproteobacteria bacterium]|nr:hypothetical protein [Alphaproteobacteria bacterium]